MQRSTAIILLLAALLTATPFSRYLAAQGQPQGIPWVGEPVKRTLGVNNGLSKILLKVHGKKGIRPNFDVQFRDTDKGLHQKVFRSIPAVTPDRLVYIEGKAIDSDGNRWFQHTFTNGEASIQLCVDLKSLGKKHNAHFTKLGYALDPKDLPFALMILVSPTSSTPYILRDLSAYADPAEALLNDEVPFEPTANWDRIAIYYEQRLEQKNPKVIVDALECLLNLPTRRVRPMISRLLHLRTSKHSEVAGLAKQVCSLNGFYSESDITAAIKALDSTDQKTVRRNVLFLRDRGLDSKRRAVPAFEKLLKREDLSKSLRELTTGALKKLRLLKRRR